MISTPQSSTSTKDMGRLDHVRKPQKVDFNTHHLMHSLDPSILTVHNSLTDISNVVHRPPTTVPVTGTIIGDLSSLLSRPHPTIHFGRVASLGCHDTDAWTQEPKVHDTMLDAAAASSLGSNSTAPDDCSPADVAGNSFALMEFRTQELWTIEQFPNATRLHEDTAVRPHSWTPLVASDSGVSPVHGPCSREGLSEGRRRVGEILVRCGVIDVSRITPIESTTEGCGDTPGALPVDLPGVPAMAAERPFRENDELSIIALADWTSKWVHTLVIRPYLQGSFRFQYYGKSGGGPTSVASRIRRVLSDVNNPVQVVIHALWFISILMGSGAPDNAPFLSVPIFRYLHNNGTFIAEDFMFRTFVACVMIGDKTVNDATLSTNIWNRLTRIPQAILNATERYTLTCLKWNTVMTRTQWQDTIIYLRSCIKVGSAFDPFAYDRTSPSGVMARYLDELIDLSYADEPDTSRQGIPVIEVLAPQPIRHFTHWGVFDAVEWCPEDDPVINQKPRTIGIAPGADRNSGTFRVGTTAKDLLDSILGSSNVTDLAHLGRPVGTSFCGSFGAIGARLAHTVKIASVCQNASWVHSHGYLTT